MEILLIFLGIFLLTLMAYFLFGLIVVGIAAVSSLIESGKRRLASSGGDGIDARVFTCPSCGHSNQGEKPPERCRGCNRSWNEVQARSTRAGSAAPAQAEPQMPMPPMSRIDQLERLAELHDAGELSDREFQTQKELVLRGDRTVRQLDGE